MELSRQHVYQVSELTSEVRQLLETSYPVIWVEGEISNLARPASGHLYFSIKDEKSQIRCAFFRNRMSRLNCQPEDGKQVRIKAQVSLYENRGDFQLIVIQLEDAGLGNLQLAFEKLKLKLNQEGLFADEHKKPLPQFPHSIGVITSASGAAVKDIITTCERRYPVTKLVLYPVQVQGSQAAGEISAALNLADQHKHDVLIVGRGGGSLEDLWAFNEEVLARTIHGCRTPVISAVGHDIDYTISDFVADVRAPTPTAAAEMATPDGAQLGRQFEQNAVRLTALIRTVINNRIQNTDMLTRRLVHPLEKLRLWKQLNAQLHERLQICLSNRLQYCTQRVINLTRILGLNSPQKTLLQTRETLEKYQRQLSVLAKTQLSIKQNKLKSISEKILAISPQSTLERGYAIVTTGADHKILRSVKNLKPRTKINVRMADGSFGATTEK